jgi:hypothetical protein
MDFKRHFEAAEIEQAGLEKLSIDIEELERKIAPEGETVLDM